MCRLLHCVICLHEAEQSFFFQGTFQHDAWCCHTFHNLRSWVLNMFSLFLQFANLQVMTTWVVTQMFGKKKLHLQGSLRSSHDNSFVKQSASSSPWWSCGFATSVELKQFRVGYYMVGFVESFIWLGAAGEQLSPRCLRCALNIRCSQKCWETHRRKWQDKQNKYISPAVSLAGPLWIIYPGWWMFRMFGCLESQL